MMEIIFRNSSWWNVATSRVDINASGTDFVPSLTDTFQLILDHLTLYLTPAIIAVGIIGNALSFCVFSITYLKRISSSLYLSTLSVADILFLIGLSIVWLDKVNCLLFSSDGWCQVVQYLTRASGFLAAWSVVSFTAERYITVYHPLRKDELCTKRKARILVSSLSLFSIIFYTFTVWIYDVVRFPGMKPICAPLPRFHFLYTVMTSLDTLVSCLAPSLIIVVLNVRIIAKIRHYQDQTFFANKTTSGDTNVTRKRCSLVQTSVSASGSMHIKFSMNKDYLAMQRCSPNNDQSQQPGLLTSDGIKRMVKSQSQYRTAKMLLIVSSVTVLLNLPTHVFKVLEFVQVIVGSNEKTSRPRIKWHQLFELIYFLNFAVNFFIYSACGRQFRTGLTRFCARFKPKLRKRCQVVRLIDRHTSGSMLT